MLIVVGANDPIQRRRAYSLDEMLRLRAIRSQVVSAGHPELRLSALGPGWVVFSSVTTTPELVSLVNDIRDSGGIALSDSSPDLERLCDGVLVCSQAAANDVRARGLRTWEVPHVIDMELEHRAQLIVDQKASVRAAVRTDAVRVAYLSYPGLGLDQDLGPALERLGEGDPRIRVVAIEARGNDVAPATHRPVDGSTGSQDSVGLSEKLAEVDVLVLPASDPPAAAIAELGQVRLLASVCAIPTIEIDSPRPNERSGGAVGVPQTAAGPSWDADLEALIGSPERRHEVGIAARRHVLEQLTTLARSQVVENLLADIRHELRPRTAPPQIRRDPPHGLRVAMLVPEPFLGSGGHTTAVRMAAGLSEAGHQVDLHIDWGPWFATASTAELSAFMSAHFPVGGANVRHGRSFAPTDALVATSWPTASAVSEAGNTWAKLYFVQDYEPYFYPQDERSALAENTYRLGFEHITIGPWLASELRRRYAATATHVGFGVDSQLYKPAPAQGAARSRVIFYARPSTARRGTHQGLEALARVKRARPDVEVVLYGSAEPVPVEFEHTNVGVLSDRELAALYRDATVGLVLSYTNVSLVPMEMMASGCPVVAVDVEPVRWLLHHGTNSVLVAPSASAMADGILSVLNEPTYRQTLSERALRTVEGLTWDAATSLFETHVREAVERAWSRDSESRATSTLTESVTGGEPSFLLDSLIEEGKESVPVDRDNVVGIELRCRGDVALTRMDVRLTSTADTGSGLAVVATVREHASAPEYLALCRIPAADIVDGEWQSFDFGPVSEATGRGVHVRIECPGAAPGRGLMICGDFQDGDGQLRSAGRRQFQPALRAFTAAPDPGHECSGPGPETTLADDWLQSRERALSELALARRELERRGVGAVARGWIRFTRPYPPRVCRPWTRTTPRWRKLVRALRLYGPATVLGEALARTRRSASTGSSVSDTARDGGAAQ